MPFTSVYAFPYQALTDAPNGALLGQDLAEAVEAEIQRVDADAAAQAAALTPVGATVAASQTTGSLTYTDLATVGPAVTLVTGSAAEVTITGTLSNSAGNHAAMSFAISGATVLAATDARSIFWASANTIRFSATYLVTGLTPGSNTFTAKYRVNIAGTGTFGDRNIHVRPA